MKHYHIRKKDSEILNRAIDERAKEKGLEVIDMCADLVKTYGFTPGEIKGIFREIEEHLNFQIPSEVFVLKFNLILKKENVRSKQDLFDFVIPFILEKRKGKTR